MQSKFGVLILKHFQWKNGEVLEEYTKKEGPAIGDELADVLYWVLLMSHDLQIDIAETFQKKMIGNNAKYPVEKAKGRSDKYDRL